ncbi:MAG: endonuclease [Rhodothermaceae bacterium]|nr:MAG: endonuclease [Rhodothermaceae bacterium]
MKAFLYGAAVLVLVATALPVVRGGAWWIRIFDFPRLQIVCFGGMVLAGLVWPWPAMGAGGRLLAGLLFLALGLQLYRIFPYTPLAAKEVRDARPGGERFRLMIANVLMTNRNTEALRERIREADPDLLLLVETDARWQEALRPLETTYPYRLCYPQDNTYGMLLFSRLPLENAGVRFLVEDDVPSMWAEVVLPSGARFDLIGVHPRPPRPDIGQDATKRDAELLLVARIVAERGRPAVVAGDLNDVAWSHTTRLFQRLSGLLDPRKGRGMYNTFHASYPFLRYPLDHVFHAGVFQVGALRRLPAFGSDHFPMFAELRFEPAGRFLQEPPAPEDGDEAEARQKIEEGREAARNTTEEEKRRDC